MAICIPIARQQVGRHIPVRHTRLTIEEHPLLGNGPVNTNSLFIYLFIYCIFSCSSMLVQPLDIEMSKQIQDNTV
jgi:hypothetical protein